MKGFIKKGTIIIGCLFLVLTFGCVTSQKSEAIRNKLRNDATADLKSAVVDVKGLAIRDLTKETVEKTNLLDVQYIKALDLLKESSLDSSANLKAATDKYITEKDRLKLELLGRAEFYTKLLSKIQNGYLAIDSLEKMNQITEDAKKSLIIDILSKDLPVVLTSSRVAGKVDPAFLNIISQYLGSIPAALPAPVKESNK